MRKKSPWSKVHDLTEDEEDLWEFERELRAIQIRIEHLGEGYPKFATPGKVFYNVRPVEGSEEDVMKFLEDILEGKI